MTIRILVAALFLTNIDILNNKVLSFCVGDIILLYIFFNCRIIKYKVKKLVVQAGTAVTNKLAMTEKKY